jgi:hypothetical protein
MNEKQKEAINNALEEMDWHHDNISEVMESFATSPAEILPSGEITDSHYEALAEWLDVDIENSEVVDDED